MSQEIKNYAEEIATMIGGNVVTTINGTGINVDMKWGNINPTVYVDDYFRDGLTTDEAARNIMMVLQDAEMPEWIAEFSLTTWDAAKRNIYPRLTKTEKGLGNMPYINAGQFGFEDLSIIFMIKQTDNQFAIVNNQMLDYWEVTVETLYIEAVGNINCEFKNLSEKLKDIDPEMELPETPIWFAGYTDKPYGAFAVIPLKPLIRDKFPDGYIVIPSSIHEMLIVPKNQANEINIDEMIVQVNNTCVNSKDILSDHAYIF